jgi:hypothetical protein
VEQPTLVLLKIVAILFSKITGDLMPTRRTDNAREMDRGLMGLQRRECGDQLRESGNMRIVVMDQISKVKMVGADIRSDP